MPIHHAIWKVGEKPTPLPSARLDSEKQLEDMIEATPEILGSDWMLIGRQEVTGFGGRIDLLAITPDASLVLIELKRDKTPREIVAQALDYAAWVKKLTADKIAQIYARFRPKGDLSADFKKRFGSALDEEELNKSHQIVLVASELDAASERIIQYLNEQGIAINTLFFSVFTCGAEKLISRAWMIDPGETQARVTSAPSTNDGAKEPWNGEYYTSFGEGDTRSWDEARRHGFISAGGGTWYTNTLRMLSPGDRVWVNIPSTGYVGVGLVQGSAQPFSEFKITTETGERAATEVLTKASYHKEFIDDPERCEYFVPVKWLDAVDAKKAIWETGFFGNQNSVCRPTTLAWRHTVERLKSHFKVQG